MFSAAPFNGLAGFGPGFAPRPQISHVVFDFDGTLSWLCHGWPGIMRRLFREHYPARPGESEAAINDLLLAEILEWNGRQTIYQMERFVERARGLGGNPPSPKDLLSEYQRRLDEVIEQRSQLILQGGARPDDFVVCGARGLLEQLRARGLRLVILSGTVEHRVKQQAQLLDLTRYFGTHIYGGTPDPAQFSKQSVIDRLLREENIQGEHLLSFGDGPVEISITKKAGGLAIAVASDEEHNGSGQMDPHKRQQLLDAGADLVIPDYRDAGALMEAIFGK
jgi:phosphoglycolate phosphatase-like HAD superfamily hydrolase